MKQAKERRKRAICTLQMKGVEAKPRLWMNFNDGHLLSRILTRAVHAVKIPKDLVPQKVIADDLCVSLVTLWRARQSGIPGFPEPIVLRNMVFWKKGDVQQLEDALMRFEGRGKFEADRVRSQRNAALTKTLPVSKRHKRPRGASDQRQMDLF